MQIITSFFLLLLLLTTMFLQQSLISISPYAVLFYALQVTREVMCMAEYVITWATVRFTSWQKPRLKFQILQLHVSSPAACLLLQQQELLPFHYHHVTTSAWTGKKQGNKFGEKCNKWLTGNQWLCCMVQTDNENKKNYQLNRISCVK